MVAAFLVTAVALFSAGDPPAAPPPAGDYAAEVRRDRPVAWWRFADPSSRDGDRAADAAGAIAGSYRGDVVLEAGPVPGGRAARFDGRSRVEVPGRPEIDVEALSVEFWFRSTGPFDRPYWPGTRTLVSRATAGANSGDWTIVGGSLGEGRGRGRVLAASGPRGAGGDKVLASRGRLDDGAWHHAVWTRAAGGGVALFVDGRRAAGGADGGGPIRNGSPIRIGGESLDGGKGVAGSIAEVAVYAAPLSAGRIRAHFAAARPGEAAGDPDRPPAAAEPGPPLESIALDGAGGLRWSVERRAAGWSLGSLSFGGKPVGGPIAAGAILFRDLDSDEERALPAAAAARTGPRSVRLSGEGDVAGSPVRFEVDVAVRDDLPAAAITPRFSVGKPLDGWEASFPFHEGAAGWRLTLYPFAGNATALDRDRLTFVGVPAALLFRPDLSLAALFGIDPASDYLDPTTWTGGTGFRFDEGSVSPRFRVGPRLEPGIDYRLPLQLFLDASGSSVSAITGLARAWVRANRYSVEPLRVRTPAEALAIFLEGRRKTAMWIPGQGYQIMDLWKVIYTAESPVSAWFDYLAGEATGDRLWRDRAFQAMDFVLGAQHRDPGDPHFGAIETNYEIDAKEFNSKDHSPNLHFKVDMNAYAARYMLELWERVKRREGIDRREWREAAVRIADWVVRQQNPDGGLPQAVGDRPDERTVSVVSGRALVALPRIARITGDPRHARLAADLERFLRREVEGRFRFTGAHVDLPAADFEADSVWHAAEYWLDKHDRTGDRECVARAEADAWLAFLGLCPKQLPWVRNPTQTCHAEQENYLQYSNYSYNNRKVRCLDRLERLTGERIFGDLRDRMMQAGFWAQVTAGDAMGGQHERMADPWKGVSGDVDSTGAVYLTELALDANLQLLEMGFAPAPAAGAATGGVSR